MGIEVDAGSRLWAFYAMLDRHADLVAKATDRDRQALALSTTRGMKAAATRELAEQRRAAARGPSRVWTRADSRWLVADRRTDLPIKFYPRRRLVRVVCWCKRDAALDVYRAAITEAKGDPRAKELGSRLLAAWEANEALSANLEGGEATSRWLALNQAQGELYEFLGEPPEPPSLGMKLTPAEKRICEVLAELYHMNPDEWHSWEEVADRAFGEFTLSTCKKRSTNLQERGVVQKHPDGRGFRINPHRYLVGT
ncbi:hypothetical protein [Botrimarina sp.]|uniref:hypothetical protein n=1 Tax=Botrimarina sp. TaxID=2795802 RepID=UPI0032F04D42